ncbi:unnamed protein product [Penicillium olsonii]|uniref:HMG box domain-containing protein n=1 Tax=Penicillium olsonii TaxID=99116 RepID=A0A9W4N3L2_PENOL|nr:unnamed protein product [Penicillium olsonii]CAG8243427.1 unnamed protein product [Penicillium olsonii]
MSQDGLWQLEDPDTVYPRRAMEIFWLDACKSLESTNGEVLVDYDSVHDLIGIDFLREMAYRLAVVRNKRIHIIKDDSLRVYRLTAEGPTDGTSSSMSVSDATMDSSNGSQITILSGSTASSTALSFSSPKIPRPPNCFILYRQAHHERVKAENPGITNNEISRLLGTRWKNESDHIRARYTELAEKLKRKHAIAHPDYQYAPRRPSERKRRATRARSQNSTVEDDLSTDQMSNGYMDVDPESQVAQAMASNENLAIRFDPFDMSVFDEPNIGNINQHPQLQAAGFGEIDYSPIPLPESDPSYMTLDDVDEMIAAYGN